MQDARQRQTPHAREQHAWKAPPVDQGQRDVANRDFSRQNINLSESPECKLSQLEPSGVGRDGDAELGQTSLGVSSPTACFLEVKSGYEEHQGEVIRRQATT